MPTESDVQDSHHYDIALSFAGEDRGFVDEVALGLKIQRYPSFYDMQCDRQVFTSGIEYQEKRSSEAGCSHSSRAFAARRENRRNGCTLMAPRFQKCQFATL